MSAPIVLTEAYIEKVCAEFREQVIKNAMPSGEIRYTKKFEYDDKSKATLTFTEEAYKKMRYLISHFDSEVGWHGICHRSEEDRRKFIISDILVFPQEVTGATVTADQIKYQTWLYDLEDEVFPHVRFHGHSHVNMGVTPSGVDETLQNDILDQMTSEDFYVFMILNKKMDVWIKIYDMKYNILYLKEDIELVAEQPAESEEWKSFVLDADECVQKKQYTSYPEKNSGVTTDKTKGQYQVPKNSEYYKERAKWVAEGYGTYQDYDDYCNYTYGYRY